MSAPTILQRKIFLLEFGEIRGFLFQRNSLARIILKFAACLINRNNAFLSAKRSFLIQLRTKDTVGTGFLNFLTEQHKQTPLVFFYCISFLPEMLLFFLKNAIVMGNMTVNMKKIVTLGRNRSVPL